MFAIALLTLKKSIALFALVEPIAVVPIFLAAAENLGPEGQQRFARKVAATVAVALLAAAFAGMPFLALLGVSLGAMQVGGGILVLLLAVAMVLGQEATFKGAHAGAQQTAREASVVPLAIPLLAGPAAFSYVMGNSVWKTPVDLIHVILPILLVGAGCWLTFALALKAGRRIHQSTMDLVERIGGFILASIAVEMIATGLRGLFPVLLP